MQDKKSVSFQLPIETYEKIKRMSEEQRRSLSGQIEVLLDRALTERELVEAGSTQIDMAEIHRRTEA